jgi:transposase
MYGGRGRRSWKKLHLGVDRSGVIIAEILTNGNADDARTALDLVDKVEGDVVSFTADAAYDTIAIYQAAAERGAKVIVPPRKTTTRSTRPSARDRTVSRLMEVGRRQWKNESGYH